MMVFILAFVILVVVVSAMSIGVILKKRPIKGSCGGMASLGFNTECDICGGDKNKCEKEQQNKQPAAAASLAYDATKKD